MKKYRNRPQHLRQREVFVWLLIDYVFHTLSTVVGSALLFGASCAIHLLAMHMEPGFYQVAYRFLEFVLFATGFLLLIALSVCLTAKLLVEVLSMCLGAWLPARLIDPLWGVESAKGSPQLRDQSPIA